MSTNQITIYDLAERKIGREARCGDDFAEAGLAMMGGCEVCGATLASYNAHPSRSGFWKCKYCIGDTGWTDVDAAAQAVFAESEPVEAVEDPESIEAYGVKVGQAGGRKAERIATSLGFGFCSGYSDGSTTWTLLLIDPETEEPLEADKAEALRDALWEAGFGYVEVVTGELEV